MVCMDIVMRGWDRGGGQFVDGFFFRQGDGIESGLRGWTNGSIGESRGNIDGH